MGYQLAKWALLSAPIKAPTPSREHRARLVLIAACTKAKDTDTEPWATVPREWLADLVLGGVQPPVVSLAAKDLEASGLIRRSHANTDGRAMIHNRVRWQILRDPDA